jgi:GNAT superfamily N-acetyltransferase
MADMQTLYRALQNAHAAGDVQAATQLATYIKSLQGQAEPIPAEPTFLGGAKAAAVRGFEAVPESASGIGLGIKAALGMTESASKQAEDIRAQAKAEASKPQGVPFADLEKAYQDQGLMAAAKKLPSYITEQALQSAPSMAVPLAAGAGAAAFAGPLAPVVGPAVGIGTYGLQQFGNFMRRQAEEGATGDTLAPAKAFGTAAVTAPIGYFADRLMLGFGNVPEKILGQQVAAELAKRAGVRAATGATVGVVAEAPTEVLEQMGERWQAGLPLKGDEAMREYKETFFGAAAVGGVGGAAAGALRRPTVTPKEEPPAYEPPVSLTGKTPAEMFQEQAAGRQGMGADVMGAAREREAAAVKARQDELDAQRATQERAAGLFEQQAAPRNEDLMQAARVRADEKAAADEELRVQAEKEAKAKRDAEAKAVAETLYSGDPAMNAIRRDEQLAALGYQMSRDKQGNDIVIPTPPAGRDLAAERAAQEAKIAEGRRADEVRQSLAGTTANEDLMASIRQRQADQAAAAAKAEQDQKTSEASNVAARVRGIMVTEYSRDPIMNNVRQREALGELGYELKLDKKGNLTPQPKQEAAPTVTPTPPLTLEKPPVTTTPEVREEYPPLTQAEVDELGLIPPAKVVTPKEPKVDYFNHPDNIGHDAAEKRELDNKGKLQVAPQPITEGGVPFTSRKSADMARKNYPEMRVLPNKNGKGFILAPKTPKQIAADEAKAKRLGLAKTSATGTPMSAHEYITSEGGIVKTEMSDLGMDKNVRVGNRFLFAGDGKGMTMEEAYTKLQEAGYLGENATQNDARNMITDSVKKPKYRPQDEEAMAKRDEEKRFEDYRKAEEEASLYSPIDEELGYEMSDFDGTGYEAADPDVQAEVRALLAQADELGIDTESMKEEVFYETETQSVQAYYKAFKSALEGAIARGREDSVQDTGEPSDAGAELTLTQPSVEEIVAKQDAAIKAEKDRKAAERAAEEQAQADEAAADFALTGSDRDADVAASRGQKDIFAGEEAELETVETPDGNTLSYAAARGLIDKGYTVLALDDPRTYVDNSGKAQRTFEKDGVRLSLSPQIVLFQDKNRVLLARGNKEDVTLEVILVDSQDRGQGKASQALKDLVDVADKNGLVLYAEPTPIKDKKTNKAGLDFEQLVKLYKKVGFDFSVYYNGPSTKVMERKPGATAKKTEPKAPPKLKKPEGFTLKENRNEQVVLAARELQAGRITKEQFDEYVDFYMPIGTIPNPERPMSQSDMKLVLQTNQISKMNAPIADGTPVGLRMDINALGRAKSQGLTGSVVAIHPENNPNSPISYSSAARIQNVRFSIRNQKAAMKVATQAEPKISASGNVVPQGNKSPQQTMEGNWVNITPDEAYAMVQRLLKDKAWSQVSFDPLRHSYFYDRATKQPVIAADDVIQVGRFVLAKNVQYSDRGEFLYMLRDATPEQIALVDAGAERYNGQTVWQRGSLALVRGWNKRTGAPVYVAVKGDTINRYDIDEKMGEHLLTSAEIKELRQVKADLEAADAKAEAENPFIKFNKDGLAFSKNLPPKIASVAKGWKEQLGLTGNIYITTTPDARVDAHNMTGQWRAVGSAALDYREAGSVRQMPNGDYYIAMQPSSSISKMLETLSHEMGHIHMYEVFNKAPAETQASIKAEYDKWLASTAGKTARELVDSLRAKTSAQTTKLEEGMTAAQMDPYWKSFKEWYADQVSRWAVTSDKPLGVVEQFFKRLADSLRAYYAKVKNAGYLPNETFKKYLDTAAEAAQKSKDMAPPPIISEDAQMEMFMFKSAGQTAAKVASTVKAAAQQKLQKREPINREALSDMDAGYVEKLGAVFNPQTKTIIDRIAGLQDGFWRRAAQGIADQYRTIKDYSEEAYMMARLSKTVDGALEGLLMHGHVYNNGGALDIKGKTKGLFEAMKPVGAETDRYMMWIALGRESRLPIEKRSPNLAPLLADRDQLVQGDINGRPRLEVYQEVQKDMNALNKSVLDVAYNAGLMDQKAYERFSQDLFYIPFYKQMESGDLQDAATASGLTSQKFSAELKGQSDKPFGDLMENTLRNWSHILSASMKNQASNATLDAAMEAGAAIPNLKVGLAWEDGKVVSSKSGEVVGDGSLRAEYTEAGKGIVKTMMNGQPAYFEVLDPMLLDSITSIGYLGPKSKFLDVARDFKNLLQYGVTISPAFKTNNLIRDSIQAIAVSDLKRNPFANVIDGWAATDKNNPAHISALAGGAIFNFGSAYEGDQSKMIKRLLAQGVKGEHILDTEEKIKAGLKVAWEKYQEWGNKSEAANRMALYNQMRERKLTHLQASFAARDLLDFSMQGSWPAFRLVTQVVPFMNARIQGLYKLGRDGVTPTARVLYNTATGKPIEQTDKQKAESFGYTTLAVAGASMALYMIFKDDEDYKKRDEWDRDNFWWFKLPGMDFAFRVPKPFEIGAFGTMAERVLEQIIDQEAEGKQFADSIKRMLGDTFALNPVPQMFKPVLDLYANKDSFTGSPIESAGMERLSKQERAADTTSPLAIALGGMTTILGEKGELSPVQVDYAIKAYFGWLGSTAAVTSHYAVMPFNDGDYPDAKWLDRASLGLIKSLPSNQSRYATAFYENNRQISQAFADMRHYAESNQTDKVMEILEEKGDKIALAKLYDQTSKKMAAVRKQIREVNANEGLTGSDKREEIDRLKELIGMYAEQAESVRKSLK